MRKKINVGYTKYKLEVKTRLKNFRTKKYHIGKNKEMIGRINHKTKTISVKKGLGKIKKKEVLYHEIAHGILFDMEARATTKKSKKLMEKLNDNEAFVSCLALILNKTFKLK